jgi:nitroreductase
MDLIDSIVKLHSTRSFKQKEIPREALRNILEAGRHTPTTHNIQPWHFIIVSDHETKEKIAKGTAGFIEKSAIVIVGCGDPEESPKMYELEVAIALQTMVVAAWTQGVGSCWVDVGKNQKEVREILDIPEKLRVVALVALGYPDKPSKPSWKKPFNEVIHYGKY